MELIKLTHANLGTEMFIVRGKICGVFYSLAHKATMVVGDGQTVFPAQESVEIVNQMLLDQQTPIAEGGNENGTK